MQIKPATGDPSLAAHNRRVPWNRAAIIGGAVFMVIAFGYGGFGLFQQGFPFWGVFVALIPFMAAGLGALLVITAIRLITRLDDEDEYEQRIWSPQK